MASHKQTNITSNTEKQFKARLAILSVLSDGQWHRNKKLKEATKLSSRTLDKHLDYMNDSELIEKKTDVINGKHAVLFKAKREILTYYKSHVDREKFVTESKKVLDERKDPLIILDAIHTTSQVVFTELLNLIQQNKKITFEEIDFLADCFLWSNYKRWTFELLQSSRKIINEIEINELLAKQAVRQIRFYAAFLKNCKKQPTKEIGS